MSGTLPAREPACVDVESASIALCIDAHPRDLGGFSVRRVLPSMHRRMVGPFIFFDHMGPASFAPGKGIDVRPHPHIELATVTYLFDGELDHRDSLGSFQTIRPGDVNWMVAGSGIAHSERTGPDARAEGRSIHGIQSWVALPTASERTAARFEHHPVRSIPTIARGGVRLDVIAGHGFGAKSPVGVLSPTLYAHARFDAGAKLAIEAEHEERAVYVVEGSIACDARSFAPGTMMILRAGMTATIESAAPSRAMIVGGATLDGDRHVWWNFVSSSKERIEQAKDDWKNDRFPKVPGDDERIPLPEHLTPSHTTD